MLVWYGSLMRSSLFNGIALFMILAGSALIWRGTAEHTITGAPPYGIEEEEVPDLDPLAWIRDWSRPDVPPTVGIQAGHWKNDELPDELERLRGNTGSSGGGKNEWEVNLSIAEELKAILEKEGIVVDIIPATVPKRYWADVFIALHADGSFDTSVRGYKFAAPWRDFTGKAEGLVKLLSQAYEEQTDFSFDPNISRNMRGYYAFSWWRFDHAIHPMTTAVIAETGFLTNYADRQILANSPEIPARAIAYAIIEFLASEGLMDQRDI